MNTLTLGACFQHELHTRPHLLPDYMISNTHRGDVIEFSRGTRDQVN